MLNGGLVEPRHTSLLPLVQQGLRPSYFLGLMYRRNPHPEGLPRRPVKQGLRAVSPPTYLAGCFTPRTC
jgi:hypothetical protein